MFLRVVGCSPAWPNPGGIHSGYVVRSGDDRVLIDCGPGVLARLRAEEGWPAVHAIVISHLHLDHCGDLVPWQWGHLHGSDHGRGTPELWLPPGSGPGIAALASRVDDAFAVREYADGVTFEAAGFAFTPRAVRHYDQPTFGLRVERDGATLAYSADTGPTDALVELARDADVVLCEATLDEPEQGQRGHLSHGEARAAADAAGAQRLLLTHRPVELHAPGFELAYDGLELELRSSA